MVRSAVHAVDGGRGDPGHARGLVAAGFRRLGGDPDRMGDRFGADLPAARRRAAGQYGPAGDLHRAAVHSAGRRAGVADRARRSSRRPTLGLARRRAAGGSGIRPRLCLGQPRSRPARPVRRRHRLGAGLFSVSLPADRRSAAAARSRLGGLRRLARPRAVARVPARRAAAAAARHLRRLAADRIAPAGRIWPVRDDPIRHLHDRHRRSVPVDL